VPKARDLPRHPLRRAGLCGAHDPDGLTTIANDSGLMAKAAREAVAGVWQEVGEFR
jgi:hypothetical protein